MAKFNELVYVSAICQWIKEINVILVGKSGNIIKNNNNSLKYTLE